MLLHLLPGAVLMGGVLLLGPPLIERGVPYDLAHIATALLTMVPFMFGAMLLYGRANNGHLTLRGVVRFRRPMPLWQYAVLYVPSARSFPTSVSTTSGTLSLRSGWSPASIPRFSKRSSATPGSRSRWTPTST